MVPGSFCGRGLIRDTTYPRLQDSWDEALQDILSLRGAVHFIVLRKRQEHCAELTAVVEVILHEGSDLLAGRMQTPQRGSVMHVGRQREVEREGREFLASER